MYVDLILDAPFIEGHRFDRATAEIGMFGWQRSEGAGIPRLHFRPKIRRIFAVKPFQTANKPFSNLPKSCPQPPPRRAFWLFSRGSGTFGGSEKKCQFRLVLLAFARLYPSAEMWPSGRRRSPAKGVGPEGSRGFESLRLRHYHLLTHYPTLLLVALSPYL